MDGSSQELDIEKMNDEEAKGKMAIKMDDGEELLGEENGSAPVMGKVASPSTD